MKGLILSMPKELEVHVPTIPNQPFEKKKKKREKQKIIIVFVVFFFFF